MNIKLYLCICIFLQVLFFCKKDKKKGGNQTSSQLDVPQKKYGNSKKNQYQNNKNQYQKNDRPTDSIETHKDIFENEDKINNESKINENNNLKNKNKPRKINRKPSLKITQKEKLYKPKLEETQNEIPIISINSNNIPTKKNTSNDDCNMINIKDEQKKENDEINTINLDLKNLNVEQQKFIKGLTKNPENLIKLEKLQTKGISFNCFNSNKGLDNIIKIIDQSEENDVLIKELYELSEGKFKLDSFENIKTIEFISNLISESKIAPKDIKLLVDNKNSFSKPISINDVKLIKILVNTDRDSSILYLLKNYTQHFCIDDLKNKQQAQKIKKYLDTNKNQASKLNYLIQDEEMRSIFTNHLVKKEQEENLNKIFHLCSINYKKLKNPLKKILRYNYGQYINIKIDIKEFKNLKQIQLYSKFIDNKDHMTANMIDDFKMLFLESDDLYIDYEYFKDFHDINAGLYFLKDSYFSKNHGINNISYQNIFKQFMKNNIHLTPRLEKGNYIYSDDLRQKYYDNINLF